MNWKNTIRALLCQFGFDLTRFHPEVDLAKRHFTQHPLVRLRRFLRQHRITQVLDVGANTGQYGRRLRQLGFSGTLLSFEPSADAYLELEKQSAGDPDWQAYRLALGATSAQRELHLAGNSQSSSLLPILDRHLDAAPEAATVGEEVVEVRALDDLFDDVCTIPGLDKESKVARLLKLDVQGFEHHVLRGAERSLARIVCLQVEMSLKPLYDGETDFAALSHTLEEKGFHLHALENGFTCPQGRLLQVDGLFFKTRP